VCVVLLIIIIIIIIIYFIIILFFILYIYVCLFFIVAGYFISILAHEAQVSYAFPLLWMARLLVRLECSRDSMLPSLSSKLQRGASGGGHKRR
jgi:hypothetical protein